MNSMVLAVPALLPIGGGILLLIVRHFPMKAESSKDGAYRRLEFLTGGITLANRLMVGCQAQGSRQCSSVFTGI